MVFVMCFFSVTSELLVENWFNFTVEDQMKPLDTEQFKSCRAVGTGRNRTMAAYLLPTQLRFVRDAQNRKSAICLKRIQLATV